MAIHRDIDINRHLQHYVMFICIHFNISCTKSHLYNFCHIYFDIPYIVICNILYQFTPMWTLQTNLTANSHMCIQRQVDCANENPGHS